MTEPRLRALLIIVALVATPAAALSWRCGAGRCEPPPAAVRVPFCSLPVEARANVEAGYRAGRSPEVIATTSAEATVNSDGSPWPSLAPAATTVPLAILGGGVRAGALPAGTTLDAVAPTLAIAAGVDRPFPEVRSGEPLAGLGVEGPDTPLLIIVAWKGVGSRQVEAWGAGDRRRWRALTDDGAATLQASTGSLPVDPAAIVTTLGTGAVPSEHGITGTFVRDGDRVVEAFADGSPLPIVATLAEDLDEAAGQRARIGLVADAHADRGLIGGGWYVGADRDDISVGAADPVAAVAALIGDGFGNDATTDMIGVSIGHAPARSLLATTAAIIELAGPRAVVAVAGTGGRATGGTTGEAVADGLVASMAWPPDVIEAVSAGGIFLDPAAAAAARVSAADVADALARLGGPNGSTPFADASPGFSIALSGYC